MSYNMQLLLSARDANVAAVMAKAAGEIEAVDKKAESANASVEKAGASMKTKLAVGGTVVAAALGYAVTSAADFDASMHNVNSLMDLSPPKFKALEKSVLDMSTKLPQSAQQLADGLYEISSSGFEGAKGLTVLKAAATAASAGLTDTETSADAIVGVLHSYGLQASDSKEVSDQLFQSVNLGVLSFHDLAQGIGNVVPMAAAAKVPLNDVLAAIDTMTRTGIQPSEAFTSLNQMFTKILNPTKTMSAAFKQLGYESGATALQTRGFKGVLDDLRKTTGGSADSTVKLYGDVRAARGAFALGSQDGALFNRMIKQQGEYAGQTGNVLAEQQKSASAQFKLLKNDVQNVAIQVGTALLPYLVKAAGGLQNLIKQAGNGAEGLAPLGHAIIDMITSLAHLGSSVQQDLGPLEHLALTGIVGSMTLLARAVDDVGQFADKHHAAVSALVVALTALKVSSVVSSGLGRLSAPGGVFDTIGLKALYARDGVSKVGTAISTAEGPTSKFKAAATGAGTALKGLGSGALGLVGGPVGALTIAVSLGAAAWENYRSQAASALANAKASGQQLLNSTNWWDPKAAQKAVEQANSQQQATEKSASSASWWKKTIGDLSTGYDMLTHNYDKAAGAAGAQQQTIEDATATSEAYNRVGQQLSGTLGISASAAAKLAQQAGISGNEIKLAGNSFSDANDKSLSLKTGLNGVSGAQDDVIKRVQQQQSVNAATTSTTTALDAAVKTYGDDASTAADKSKALEAAIQGLVTPGTDLQKSVQGWEDTMRTAVTAAEKAKGIGIDPLTNAFHTQSQAGKDAAAAMNNIATQTVDVISKMAEAHKPTKDMNEVLGESVGKFEAAGAAAGLTKKQIQTYMDTLGLTPKIIATQIKLYGDSDAKTKAKTITTDLKSVPHEVRVQANLLGDPDVNTRLRIMHGNMNEIPKNLPITVSTPGAADSALALLNVARKANDLPPLKRLPVTTPGINDAISLMGSLKTKVEKVPGHKNTDIKALDNATSVLQSIQTQIGKVKSKNVTIGVEATGHWSVVSSLLQGGTSKSNGVYLNQGKKALGGAIYGPGGPTDDKIPAWLSNGEFVINAASTAKYRPQIEAINAGKFAAGGAVAPVTNVVQKEQAWEQKNIASLAKTTADATKQQKAESDASAVSGGAGVQQWAPMVLKALTMEGQPASLLQTVLRRMNQESGGNPRAINNTDINAQRGDPSRGLMQTIMSTFLAYHWPGSSNNIYDPLANILASMGYAISRYGSLSAAYNRPGGYAGGGEVRGAGTGTSDQVPAWLSNGEFVVNAASSAKHGPLLHAINAGHYAKGGMVEGPDGELHTRAYLDRLKRDQAAAKTATERAEKEASERAAREREASRQATLKQQYLTYRAYTLEQGRLSRTPALDPSLFDAGSAVSSYQAQAEAMAQNRASILANRAQRAGNSNATSDDYYKAPKMMTQNYLDSFNAQLKNANEWSHNLSVIAQRAGSGVAMQLEQMGAAGEDLVTKMANTTETQTKRMAKALTDLAGTAHQATQDFQFQMRDETARTAQFNADLMTLLNRGDVDLVTQLSSMGVDAGYQIARQAVTESGRDKSLTKDIKASNKATDPNLTKALALAAILEAGHDDIGITGLAAESGDSIADVWTLLAQYNAQVFHKLAGKMDPIRRDQALVGAGKALSGLAGGGIVSGGATGLYYRWAEPSSKGESLIPHDPANRNRARALWAETGRIIGAGATHGSASKVVAVSEGAIKMQLTVNGSNLTAGDVQRIAAQQTTAAVNQLVNQVKARV